MTRHLNGKVALVTAAASGIGSATVELIHLGGATVIATDIDAIRGEALVARLASFGAERFARWAWGNFA